MLGPDFEEDRDFEEILGVGSTSSVGEVGSAMQTVWEEIEDDDECLEFGFVDDEDCIPPSPKEMSSTPLLLEQQQTLCNVDNVSRR